MSLHRLRSLSVINSDTHDVVGQISSKGIINYIYNALLNQKLKDEKKLSASHIMTQGLIIIEPTAQLQADRITMMKESIDQLPVSETKENGKIVIKGVVTSD